MNLHQRASTTEKAFHDKTDKCMLCVHHSLSPNTQSFSSGPCKKWPSLSLIWLPLGESTVPTNSRNEHRDPNTAQCLGYEAAPRWQVGYIGPLPSWRGTWSSPKYIPVLDIWFCLPCPSHIHPHYSLQSSRMPYLPLGHSKQRCFWSRR